MAGVAVLLEIQNLLGGHVNNGSDREHGALVLKENHMLEFHVVQSVRTLTITIHSRCVSWHGDRTLRDKGFKEPSQVCSWFKDFKAHHGRKDPKDRSSHQCRT